MIGRTLSHYKVLSEISRGGMGIVYRALDVKLEREVALKVLPPELVADPERKRRFVQEAKAAAKLEHPHIGVVHEIDEVDSTTFIAMELIRGEQLRDTIGRGSIPLRRALEIATDIAEGIAKAHDEGIVHRDLKPANVMVTDDGHTKIIDFGLAKLVEPLAGEGSDIETLTRGETDPAKVMGTVSYMSPEQARGQKVDHRSDIFSFGVVLNEMLTGDAVFQKKSAADTLSAILNQATPTLAPELAGDATADLQRVSDKCLAKDPSERYQTAKDVVVDLRAVRRRLESGAVEPLTPKSRRGLRWVAAAAAILIVSLLTVWLVTKEETPPPATNETPSIAVLLFDNINNDPELDWLRLGLTEMLVTDLSQSPHIQVLSTERLYQILGDMRKLDERVTSLDVVQYVAERANSRNVVHGSFMRAGDNIRINVRVQDPTSGEILSTEKVEGKGESAIFSMVDDLTRRLKTRLEVPAFTDAELNRPLTEVTTSSPEAYRYYVEGAKAHLALNNTEAILSYKKAVELDPGFAMALAKLEVVHSTRGLVKEAREYMRRAFENSERLPARDRYYLEGNYYRLSLETWGQSIEAYKKAIRLYPDHAAARNNLGVRYSLLERYDESIEQHEANRQRGYFWAHRELTTMYTARGQFDEGYRVLQKWLTQKPNDPAAYHRLGIFFAQWGELQKALDAVEKVESLDTGNPRGKVARWLVFSLRGQWERADAEARMVASLNEPYWKRYGASCLAIDRLYQGQSEASLSFLETAMSAYKEPNRYVAQALNDTSQIFLERGRIDEALAYAQGATEAEMGWFEEWKGLYFMALAYEKLGRREEVDSTVEQLARKADLVPSHIGTRLRHQLLGELALVRGNWSSAIRELDRAQSMLSTRWGEYQYHWRSEHVPIWFSLGRAYFEAGQEDQATPRFQRVVDSTNERLWWPIPYVRSFYFLGKIHENRGDMEKAREYYRRFYEYWKDGDMDRERVEEVRSKLGMT
jgi:serine/threonine protein kinase/tetratricopeptide (TPR) repeat protein